MKATPGIALGAALATGAATPAGASVRIPYPETVPQAVHVHVTAQRFYTVQPGQYLSEIAGSQCGNPADWRSLYSANQGKVSDPDMIYPGEHLVIDCSAPVTQYRAPQAVTETVSGGILSPAQIGALWLDAGGSPAAEDTAECIAHFESGGNTSAISPTDDFGVFQINASHGPEMATLNPLGNARAAVEISADGTNWSPWTTAPSCGV
jgi:LysM repeat protein